MSDQIIAPAPDVLPTPEAATGRSQTPAGPLDAQAGHAVLRRVVAAARALTAADAGAILLYDRARDLFVPVVPSVAIGLDDGWLQQQGLTATRSLGLRAVETHYIVEVRDTAATPDLDYPLLAGGRRPGAVAVAPLEIDGAVVGVLGLYNVQPRDAPLDREALRAFAELAGHAITIAQAHERESALLARLGALDAASTVLAAELSLERVLQRIVEIAVQIAGARYGALGVAGSDSYLTDFITTGITPEERARIGPLPRGHGLLGVLIREGQPLRVPSMAHDPRRVGFPPHHPPMTSLLGVPIRVHKTVVGDLYLTDKIGAPEFSEEDQHLVQMLAAHAGVAIENARLYAQVGELTRLRERERIARDLHDSIIQDIYAATLQLEDVSEDVTDVPLQERLLDIANHLSDVITDVRTYIQGLRARELEGRLLNEGMAALVREVEDRSGLAAGFAVEGDVYRLPDETANTVLHIAREAFSNVVKHAGATRVEARLAYSPAGATLTVTDDGRGFDPAAPRDDEHRGLRNLRGRAEEAGGSFSAQSTLGAGTTIRAFLPIAR